MTSKPQHVSIDQLGDALGLTSPSAEDEALQHLDDEQEFAVTASNVHVIPIPTPHGAYETPQGDLVGTGSGDSPTAMLAAALASLAPMPSGMSDYRRREVAELAGPTVWNDERRSLEDAFKDGTFKTKVRDDMLAKGHVLPATHEVAYRVEKARAEKLTPWRIENHAHLGQCWLVDGDNRGDRLFAYVTADGSHRLLMVTDDSPGDEWPRWTAIGWRDVPNAPDEMRVIRSAVRAVTQEIGARDGFAPSATGPLAGDEGDEF